MTKIGIFFGTDSGATRLVAKKIAKRLGEDVADKPLNINRVGIDQLLRYHALILGTPTYGQGELPSLASGAENGSWTEFLPGLDSVDLSGTTVALYGLGDQEKYPERFADALLLLYRPFREAGARLIGDWSTEGYTFGDSRAVVNGRFVGLAIDHHSQPSLTEGRIDAWLAQVEPTLLQAIGLGQPAAV
jgi:flavodoxin I